MRVININNNNNKKILTYFLKSTKINIVFYISYSKLWIYFYPLISGLDVTLVIIADVLLKDGTSGRS